MTDANFTFDLYEHEARNVKKLRTFLGTFTRMKFLIKQEKRNYKEFRIKIRTK